MPHPLHRRIGEFLREIPLPPDCCLLLAPECGGDKIALSMFCNARKGSDTRYCNVDGLIVRRSEICFALEIEESGLNPTKICGKFLTTALSTNFIHRVLNNSLTVFNCHLTFVQILDAQKLKERTKKIVQSRELERSIQGILPIRGASVRDYRLFVFRGVRGFDDDPETRHAFQQTVVSACSAPATVADGTAL